MTESLLCNPVFLTCTGVLVSFCLSLYGAANACSAAGVLAVHSIRWMNRGRWRTDATLGQKLACFFPLLASASLAVVGFIMAYALCGKLLTFHHRMTTRDGIFSMFAGLIPGISSWVCGNVMREFIRTVGTMDDATDETKTGGSHALKDHNRGYCIGSPCEDMPGRLVPSPSEGSSSSASSSRFDSGCSDRYLRLHNSILDRLSGNDGDALYDIDRLQELDVPSKYSSLTRVLRQKKRHASILCSYERGRKSPPSPVSADVVLVLCLLQALSVAGLIVGLTLI